MRVGSREIGFGRRREMRGGGRQRMRAGGGGAMRWIPWLLVIWLIIGAIAAGQRGYFTDADANCATAGTIFVTVIAGPLNYLGVNPEVTDCHMPQPSP